MKEFLQEKSELATHIRQGNWDELHQKTLKLLQKMPEDIELIVLMAVASAYGSFFEDALRYGNDALQWSKDNGRDLETVDALLHTSTVEMQGLMAQSYFGVQDFSSAKRELDKIVEDHGKLPDDLKQFAVKNEYQLNGAEAAVCLAEELSLTFLDKRSKTFLEFKIFEAMMCFNERISITGQEGLDFPKNMSVSQAQKIAWYFLKLADCLGDIEEDLLTQDIKHLLQFSQEWLTEIFCVLYKGESLGKPEMETNNHYAAAKDCILVLEKLSDMGVGFAQCMLGEIYANAYNVKKDDKKAFHYYQCAYEHGVKDVLVKLALYYQQGIVTDKNLEKALAYAKEAAELRLTMASTTLGQIYVDFGDIENGLSWLRKAYLEGDKIAQGIAVRLAKENIADFDKKLGFILDINERMQKDAASMDSQLDLGKKYVKYYMEIEKYYIAPLERLTFLVFCADAQPESLTQNNGFVSVNYFEEQFEKWLQEEPDLNRKISYIRTAAKRASTLKDWEFLQILAGSGDLNNLGWENICKYIYRKSEDWGWDRRMADGEEWNYRPGSNRPSQGASEKKEQADPIHTPAGNSSTSNYHPSGSGGCYIATSVYGSYDCPEVWVLRRFRDYSLSRRVCGRILIKIYYAISPSLVRLFGNAEWFRHFWRTKLDVFIKWLKSKGFKDSPYNDDFL